MSFNKAKEEHRWTIWKNAEEKQMRQLGVSEDTIEQLRVHDWAVFNSDRRYYRRLQDGGTYLESIAESDTQTEIKTVEELMDSIDNEILYQTLLAVDKLSLQIPLGIPEVSQPRKLGMLSHLCSPRYLCAATIAVQSFFL